MSSQISGLSLQNLSDRVKRLDRLAETATDTDEYCRVLVAYQEARDALTERLAQLRCSICQRKANSIVGNLPYCWQHAEERELRYSTGDSHV